MHYQLLFCGGVANSSLSLSSNTPSFIADTSLQVRSQRFSLLSEVSPIARYKDFMAVLFLTAKMLILPLFF